MEDEIYLVECIRKRDRAAFDQIYERYQNRILRMAYLIVGNLDENRMALRRWIIFSNRSKRRKFAVQSEVWT